MTFNNMNIKKFINHIKEVDNVDSILQECKTATEKGHIFERLYDIVIKFGYCDKFPRSNFNNFIGNSSTADIEELKNIDQYLNKKVIGGNTSGVSDITLQNKNDEEYIFISSKYSNEDIKKQKSVSDYDVQGIVTMAEHYKVLILYI